MGVSLHRSGLPSHDFAALAKHTKAAGVKVLLGLQANHAQSSVI